MDIVQHAFAFSDIEVLKAYIDCFDPGMWFLGRQERLILKEVKI